MVQAIEYLLESVEIFLELPEVTTCLPSGSPLREPACVLVILDIVLFGLETFCHGPELAGPLPEEYFGVYQLPGRSRLRFEDVILDQVQWKSD